MYVGVSEAAPRQTPIAPRGSDIHYILTLPVDHCVQFFRLLEIFAYLFVSQWITSKAPRADRSKQSDRLRKPQLTLALHNIHR